MISSKSSVVRCCAVVVAALTLFVNTIAFGQDDEPALVLAHAREQYIGGSWEESVDTLDGLITTLEGIGDALDAESETLLVNAYELRALAKFNIKQEDAAREDFRRILALRPLHELTKDFSFPVIVEFFENVRRQTVGYLTISTTPSGATVFLDENELGLTDLVRLPLLAGEHAVRLEKTGFAVAQQVISVAPDVETALALSLERTTASIEIWTSPSGVEVYLDGKLHGITEGVAEEAKRSIAEAQGLAIEEISARYVLENVPLGEHTIEFRKDCYRADKRKLPEITIARDYSISDPIILAPAVGGIALENVPARARLFINGREQERGKMGFEGLCPGEYSVHVLSEFGRFSIDATVEDGMTKSIPVKLHPGLLLAEPVYASGGQADTSGNWQVLADTIKAIDTFDVVAPEEPINGEVRALLEVIPRIEAGEAIPALDARLHGIVRQLCRRANVHLIAIPVVSERSGADRLRMLLFSYEVARVEVATVVLNDEQSHQRFVGQLAHNVPSFGTWHGITAIDTNIHGGPVVLAVQAGSPADRAGIAPGQVITAVDGEPISGYRTLQETLASKTVGEKIQLAISEQGETAEREIVLAQSPMLLPLNNAPVFYNAAIATFALAAETSDDSVSLNLARLNKAIALAHFGAWDEAIQYLKLVDLGSGAGVNQGTVYFLIGRSYEHLGYSTEALDYYNRALPFESATLDSNDGPPLQPRLQQRIDMLRDDQ